MDPIQHPPVSPLHQDPLPPRRQRDPHLRGLRAQISSRSGDAQDPTVVEETRREESQSGDHARRRRSQDLVSSFERRVPFGYFRFGYETDATVPKPDQIFPLR